MHATVLPVPVQASPAPPQPPPLVPPPPPLPPPRGGGRVGGGGGGGGVSSEPPSSPLPPSPTPTNGEDGDDWEDVDDWANWNADSDDGTPRPRLPCPSRVDSPPPKAVRYHLLQYVLNAHRDLLSVYSIGGWAI